jgi:hypothetical protein
MAKSEQNDIGQVTKSATGASDHLELSEGSSWKLTFVSAGAYALDLQEVAGDSTTFVDSYYDDTTTQVEISSTGRQAVVVPAGWYRMNVTTYNNPITMYARRT